LELLIRDVQANDAKGIVDIFNPIIEAGLYTVFDTPFTIDAEREYILNFPERGIFHVAVQQPDRTIVGFQSMEPFATYTQAFAHVGVVGTYVASTHRRQGVASKLFCATFEVARKKGYEKIFTYIRADNEAALSTYLGQGFRIIGTAQKQAKINGKDIDEIIIEKLL
jgi:L-amino acid N-acyltransferase YncA